MLRQLGWLELMVPEKQGRSLEEIQKDQGVG